MTTLACFGIVFTVYHSLKIGYRGQVTGNRAYVMAIRTTFDCHHAEFLAIDGKAAFRVYLTVARVKANV